MPQMAPLWWEILFLMFIMMYMFTSIIIYFSFNKSSTSSANKNKIISQLKWSW
uniref:ATP synthase F0 subunit 8 n=1 Tax=Palomena viridissima TaxID=763224 RepID=A0A7D5FUK3_9HEMI|nr:ATP synthase F0 subunit 8 [Palomena viridissima]QLF99776.1 ATP synthase F0 subunit 8 [Palomena viridissima]